MERFKKLGLALQEQGVFFLTEEPLAKYTSFKIGGPCRVLIAPSSEEEIIFAVDRCRENQIPYLILGNGSNMLVSDKGYNGAVILLGHRFSRISLLEDGVTVRAEAGASLAKVCMFAKEHGLSGLEFAYGIPATVGGAVYMNAGAYGGEMKDVLRSARHITSEGKTGCFQGKELRLSYRHSVYSDSSYCVTSADFRLKPGNPDDIMAAMEDVMGRRKEKQPLEYPSAGSTFKRPEGAFAAKLIEDCGLKGVRVGGAMVSPKHSGFVINYDGATCQDVLSLIALIQKKVKEQTGFCLECEVKYID